MRLSFPMLESWATWSGLGLGLLTPKVSLLIFIHHMWMWDHPICCHCLSHHTASLHLSACLLVSAPPTHLDERGFFKSLVVGLPYSSNLWQFWVLFVLKFSCNSPCGCVTRLSTFTYASILTRSQVLYVLKILAAHWWKSLTQRDFYEVLKVNKAKYRGELCCVCVCVYYINLEKNWRIYTYQFVNMVIEDGGVRNLRRFQ